MHVQVHTTSQNFCYKTIFVIKLIMKQLSLKRVFNALRTDSFQNIFSKEIFMKENYTRWFYLQETMTNKMKIIVFDNNGILTKHEY